VTFDIDANGIVHVSAKDMGTGKSQSIQITANSGLSEEEIKRMVRDAEANAAEDKKKTESIQVRNQLDGLVYQTEKSMTELGAKVDASLKGELETAITAAKAELEKGDKDAMQGALDNLNKLNAKLAEQVYANAQAQGGADAAGQQASGSSEHAKYDGSDASGNKKDDDTVDADFKEV